MPDIWLACQTTGFVTFPGVRLIAKEPIILAMANPVPEIMPEGARAVGAVAEPASIE